MIVSGNAIYGVVGGLTFLYCVYEIYVALTIDSMTLLSDGFHNVSDVLALVIGWQS